ncbi:MAG: DUF4426 domain-containing protein [Thermomonas hydrothermalis]|uniref:DUF4426 domain-containing protein n=1 Tax=Thermomonas hydrothermalis TaxID=213588 RepID=UPI002357890A|nr:DUF4426 domain-containing protein [Thermomonas hydrothermalis]MCL6618755.1 DUF4426 domain-containing protein [Thermomonas hydrothermalis]
MHAPAFLRAILSTALFASLTTGCTRTPDAPTPADAVLANSTSTVTARADDAVFQAVALDIAQLDPTTAKRYGLDTQTPGALLLVTLRDAAGNGLPPDDLVLTATANTLTDPPRALGLHHLQVDGLNDYVGVFAAQPPAQVQFHITAVRHGQRATLETGVSLYPR